MAAAASNFLPGNAIPPPPLPTPTPLCSAINQVVDNQYWIILTLGNSIHGTQSIRDILTKFNVTTTNGKLFHSWVDTAKQNKKLKNIPDFVWKKLLGTCAKGCRRPCNRETNIDDLDITSLVSIYNNAEHIIPSNILSQAVIMSIKKKYEKPVKSIQGNRNKLAHYSFKKNMSKPEFDDQWIEIRDTLVAMSYDQSKMTEFYALETCSFDSNLKQIVMAFNDTMQVLENDKCNKSEFESFKLIVRSLITKCRINDIKIKVDLECIIGAFASFFILLICINLSK